MASIRARRYVAETAFVWTEIGAKLRRGLEHIFRSFLINTSIDMSGGRVFVPSLPEDELYDLLYNGLMRALIYAYGKYKFGDEDDILPEEVKRYIEEYIPTIWQNLEKEIIEQIETIVRNLILEGLDIKQREQAMKKIKLQDIAKQRIEMITRTEITRADALGKLISAVDNPEIDGFRFTAVLDDRTSDICLARNGLTFRWDDPRLPENTPPLHVRCRSMLIPIRGQIQDFDYEGLPPSKQRDSYRDIIRAIQSLR